MIYDLNLMLNTQKELNLEIQKTQNKTREETWTQAHLCILIELMELCNETRCFNYWSKKTRSSDDCILEEFADVLCFLLTELLEINISKIEINEKIKCENNLLLTNRFIKLVDLYNLLNINEINTYQLFTEQLFELGYALGYNIDLIYGAYLKKVAKNYEVQKQFKI